MLLPGRWNPKALQMQCLKCPMYLQSPFWSLKYSPPAPAAQSDLHRRPEASPSPADNNPSAYPDPESPPGVPSPSGKSSAPPSPCGRSSEKSARPEWHRCSFESLPDNDCPGPEPPAHPYPNWSWRLSVPPGLLTFPPFAFAVSNTPYKSDCW